MLRKEDLLVLEQWSKEWHITFNVAKCASLQIGKKMVEHPGYNLCGVELDQVDSHQYLGIHLKSNLKWDEHINEKVNKATQKLAMIWRVLKFAVTKTKKR